MKIPVVALAALGIAGLLAKGFASDVPGAAQKPASLPASRPLVNPFGEPVGIWWPASRPSTTPSTMSVRPDAIIEVRAILVNYRPRGAHSELTDPATGKTVGAKWFDVADFQIDLPKHWAEREIKVLFDSPARSISEEEEGDRFDFGIAAKYLPREDSNEGLEGVRPQAYGRDLRGFRKVQMIGVRLDRDKMARLGVRAMDVINAVSKARAAGTPLEKIMDVTVKTSAGLEVRVSQVGTLELSGSTGSTSQPTSQPSVRPATAPAR